MELLMKEVKGYSDREEDVEEEEAEIRDGSCNKYYPFFSTSSPSSTNYKTHHHHHQNSWLGLHDHHSPEATTTTESHNSSSGLGLHHQDAAPPASNFINLMDLSLGNKNDEVNFHGGSSSNTGHNCNDDVPIEKEHMFDKVVTPSDVGKLNRLVIPKQHAEKYFPLDSSSNEKGLLLNFEDQNGKLWRFRYSYWNSSQSYVMTKGWSRFVKEKKLDAGDIVSFRRGVGELYRHRLYIDWRRRPDHHQYCPDHPTGTLIAPLLLPNHQPHLSQYSIRWGGRLYSLPSPSPARHHEHLQQLNYNNMFLHQHQHQHQFHYNEVSSGSGSVYYLRSASTMGDQNLMGQQDGGNNAPMIIDSVPVSHHHRGHPHHGKNSSTSTAAKRLRLFGVNMECASSSSSSTPAEEPKFFSLISSSSTSSVPPYLRVPHEDPLSSSARFQNQEGETAMLFDLDPSLQYRQ